MSRIFATDTVFKVPLDLDGNPITNLADAVDATDAVTKQQLDAAVNALIPIDLASEVTGVLPVSNGGTGNTSFTQGSVLFFDGNAINEDNANLFWDNTNKRLGIGIINPTSSLDVAGKVRSSKNGSHATIFHDGSNPYYDFYGGSGAIFNNNASNNVSSPNLWLSNDGRTLVGALTGPGKFGVYGSGNVIFNTSGTVGIGTTNPSINTKVHINCGAAESSAIYASNNGHNTFALNVNGVDAGWSLYDFTNSGWHRGLSQKLGRVGIGTTTPSEKLQVAGNIAPTLDTTFNLGTPTLRWDKVYARDIVGNINPSFTPGSVVFAGSDGSLTEDNAGLYWDATNKRLGVGTNAPISTLHVNGPTQFDSYVTIKRHQYNWERTGIQLKRVDNTGTEITVGGLYTGGKSSGGPYPVYLSSTLNTDGTTRSYTNMDLAVWPGGSIGIGTSQSPLGKVQVKGGHLLIDGGTYLGFVRSTDNAIRRIIGTQEVGTSGTFDINIGYNSGLVGDFVFQNGAGEVMRIKNDGNVGIGTSSPTDMLHINGGAIKITSPSGSYSSRIRTADNYRTVIESSADFEITNGTGSFGIGMDGDFLKNHRISDNGYNTSSSGFSFLAGHLGSLGFRTNGTTSTFPAIKLVYGDNSRGGIAFYTKYGGADYERMRIADNGNVGISTTNPLSQLDLGGKARHYWGQFSHNVAQGQYTEFFELNYENNGSAVVEIELSQSNYGHVPLKYIFHTDYNYFNKPVGAVYRVIPVMGKNRRNYSTTGWGSGHFALETVSDTNANGQKVLVFRLRQVAPTDQTISVTWHYHIKSTPISGVKVKRTGVDTSNYNYPVAPRNNVGVTNGTLVVNVPDPEDGYDAQIEGNLLTDYLYTSQQGSHSNPVIRSKAYPTTGIHFQGVDAVYVSNAGTASAFFSTASINFYRDVFVQGQVGFNQGKSSWVDAASDPTVSGELWRNGSLFKFHDGTNVRTFAYRDWVHSYGRKVVSFDIKNYGESWVDGESVFLWRTPSWANGLRVKYVTLTVINADANNDWTVTWYGNGINGVSSTLAAGSTTLNINVSPLLTTGDIIRLDLARSGTGSTAPEGLQVSMAFEEDWV